MKEAYEGPSGHMRRHAVAVSSPLSSSPWYVSVVEKMMAGLATMELTVQMQAMARPRVRELIWRVGQEIARYLNIN